MSTLRCPMNLTNLFTLAAPLLASLGASDASAQEPADTNYDEAKVPEYVRTTRSVAMFRRAGSH